MFLCFSRLKTTLPSALKDFRGRTKPSSWQRMKFPYTNLPVIGPRSGTTKLGASTRPIRYRKSAWDNISSPARSTATFLRRAFFSFVYVPSPPIPPRLSEWRSLSSSTCTSADTHRPMRWSTGGTTTRGYARSWNGIVTDARCRTCLSAYVNPWCQTSCSFSQPNTPRNARTN